MIKPPRGTQDILPQQWPLWNHVLESASGVAESAGYQRIETPTFEPASLFTHATGEHTDVNREMYTFRDRGHEELALRPEGTAPVFRAYFQHGMQVLPQPVKLYYVGSMFRYERPQAGRWREHHQFGCEAIGSEDPLVDASLVDLQLRFYRRAGLPNLTLHVNTIGDENCRPAYLRKLVVYLREHASELCGQCRERIDRNPLRVLDCKVEPCQPVLNNAPHMLDELCDPCRDHWNGFLKGLDVLEIDREIDPRLVRGLDYYTRTVWEFMPEIVTGATSTIGGGGRYDALARALHQRPTPAVGFSTGLERVLLHVKPEIVEGLDLSRVDVFLSHVGEEAEFKALAILRHLLCRDIRSEMSFGSRSLKAQLKHANGRGARIAVIIGQDELDAGVAALRNLESGEQERVPLDVVVQRISEILGATQESRNDSRG